MGNDATQCRSPGIEARVIVTASASNLRSMARVGADDSWGF